LSNNRKNRKGRGQNLLPFLSEKGGAMEIEEIKSRLSMKDIIDYYGITGLKEHRNRLSGPCPIHNGDNPNAFQVSLDKNLWHCFTRNHGGDVLSFIMEYEQVNFAQALKIARNILNVDEYKPRKNPNPIPEQKSINQPLRFKLKLNPEHIYLKQRGLSKETIEDFGIGFCNQGILKNRIAIPIHNETGNLIAYAGRSINNDEPKYKFPIGFNKSLALFNFHRVQNLEDDSIIIVEGFFDCFKVHRIGFQNVIALMGCSASKEQTKLILELKKKIILMLDGDQAGREGTKKIVQAFKGKLPVIVKSLPSGTQPDELKEKELQKILQERR